MIIIDITDHGAAAGWRWQWHWMDEVLPYDDLVEWDKRLNFLDKVANHQDGLAFLYLSNFSPAFEQSPTKVSNEKSAELNDIFRIELRGRVLFNTAQKSSFQQYVCNDNELDREPPVGQPVKCEILREDFDLVFFSLKEITRRAAGRVAWLRGAETTHELRNPKGGPAARTDKANNRIERIEALIRANPNFRINELLTERWCESLPGLDKIWLGLSEHTIKKDKREVRRRHRERY